VIFETRKDYLGTWAGVDRSAPEERIWFIEKPGLIEIFTWIGDRTGAKNKIDLPPDAVADEFRGWLTVKLRSAWTIGGETFEPDYVIGISFAPFLAGDRHFTKLFEPEKPARFTGPLLVGRSAGAGDFG
jgi:prolyl oligopeptidase